MAAKKAQNRIPKIVLSDSAKEKLVRRLNDMIEMAVEFHGRWEDLHDIYLNQYLCKPEVAVKTTPFPGASNVFAPVGRVIQDGVMSQLHNAMFSNDPVMKVIGGGARTEANASLLSTFYNDYVYKQLVPIKQFGNQFNFMCCLDGTVALKHRWDRSRQLRREIFPRIEPKYAPATIEMPDGTTQQIDQVVGTDDYFEEVVTAEIANRPSVELSDLNNLFIAPDTTSESGLQWPGCPWYYQLQNLTWDALLSRKSQGYDGIDDALKAQAAKREVDQREATKRDYEGLNEYTSEDVIPVMEFYMRLALPCKYKDETGAIIKQTGGGDGDLAEEVIVTYLPDTDTISRIVPLWRVYADGRRPHIANWYNQLPLSFYGQGIQAKMRMINELVNSSMNMMVDSGKLANMPFFFYAPALTGLLPEINGLIPGQGVPVHDPRGVTFPRFQHDQSWFLNVIQQAQAFAERDGNITDFSLGRAPEKSTTKTAKGTIALLQMGQVAFGRLASMMVQPYEELFRSIHMDYKRNAPDQIFFRVTDQNAVGFRNLSISREQFAEEVDFQFVLNPNTQAEQQLNQILFQLMTAIPYVQSQPRAVRALSKQMYESAGKKNFNEIWPEEMEAQIETQMAAQQMMAQQQAMMQQGGMPPGGPAAGPPQPAQPAEMPMQPQEAEAGSLDTGQFQSGTQPQDKELAVQ